MYVTKIKLDQVYLDEGPFEKLSDQELEMLIDSIRDFGLIYPIVVQEKEGTYVIIDGRNRVRALKKLGLTEAPAIVIQDEDLRKKNILQYDLEIFRRHLPEEEKKKALSERKEYNDALKKSIRLQIFHLLKLEDSSKLKEILDTMSLNQLIEFYNSLKTAISIPGFQTRISKTILLNEVTNINHEDKTADKSDKIEQIYKIKIEELEEELRQKEELILELEEEKEKVKEMYLKTKKELDEFIESSRSAINKIKEQLENEFNRYKEEFLKNFAKENLTEEIEKLANEYASEKIKLIEENYKKQYEKLSKEIVEWKAKLDNLRYELQKKDQIINKMNEEKKDLENKIKHLKAEKERYEAAAQSYKYYLKKISSYQTLVKKIELVKASLTEIINLVTNFDIIIPEEEKDFIKRNLTEIEEMYATVKEVIEKTLSTTENKDFAVQQENGSYNEINSSIPF